MYLALLVLYQMSWALSVFHYLFQSHFRGIPLHKVHDRSKLWRRMEEDNSVFVYREGTLDQAAYASHHKNKNDLTTVSKGCNSMLIRNKGTSSPTCCIVPLKDIIV